MSAATKDINTPKLGTEEIPDVPLLALPMEANTIIYGGTMVASNAAGNAVPAGTAGALVIWGRAERQVDNRNSSPTGGAARAAYVQIRKGPFYMNQDGSITQANIGQNAFATDDNTLSLTDGGGTRLYAGVIQPLPKSTTAALAATDQVAVWLGLPNAYAANPELVGTAGQYKVRAVVTSLQAYTGTGTGVLTETANGAWAAQDGVTNAVGDVVFIQEGTTNLTGALDAGPWQITSLGSAGTKWVLTRPDWWAHGSAIVQGAVVDAGGEGTVWGGSTWKTFVATGQIVGTNAPLFWVRELTQAVTLVTGFVTKTNVGIRSTTLTGITFTPTNFNGAGSTVSYRTGAYASGGAATVAGVTGTGSVSITALVAAGTFNTSDVGTGLLTVNNW